MGAIKDVVDLTEKLLNRVKNREFANDVKNILSLIMAVQRDQIETEDRNRKLAEENTQLKIRIAELEKVEKTSVTRGRDKPSRMSGEEIKLLQALAHIENQNAVRLSQEIGASVQKTKYYLNKLVEKNLAIIAMVSSEDLTYNLTEEGRAWLAEADLLD